MKQAPRNASQAGPLPVAPVSLLAGTVCYFSAALFWGMNVPMTAALFATFDIFFLTVLRTAIATVVLAAMLVLGRGRTAGVGIDTTRLAALSLLLAAFFTFYNLGLLFTDPITAAAVLAGAPVYAALTLRLFRAGRLGPGFAVAAAMTIMGASVAIWGRAVGAGGTPGLRGGEIFLVAGFVCWNLYSLYSQRWFEASVSQLRRTTLTIAATAVWLTGFWLVSLAAGLAGPPNLDPTADAIVYLLVTAVFATAVGPFVWNIGVSHMGLAAGSLWQNMVPVFAVLIAMFFGVRPAATQVAGGAMVIGGVLYMQWRRWSLQNAAGKLVQRELGGA